MFPSQSSLPYKSGAFDSESVGARGRRRAGRFAPGKATAALVALVALLAAAVALPFAPASASSRLAPPAAPNAPAEAAPPTVAAAKSARPRTANARTAAPVAAAALQPTFVEEKVETFEADCVTPKAVFNLGDTVCAKVSGAPAPFFGGFAQRRVNWISPGGDIVNTTPVTQEDQTVTFTLPSTPTSTVNGVTSDNRGEWAVNSVSTLDAGIRSAALFDARGAQDAADLGISKYVTKDSAKVAAGSDVTFLLFVYNAGPNAAANVEITDVVPANTTFESADETGAPGFTCVHPSQGGTGTSVCSIATFPSRSAAVFRFVYKVSTGAPDASFVTNSAAIESDTADPRASNNQSSSSALIFNGGGQATCTLSCPANVVATANTTQGGLPGAFVNYGAATVNGECGAVSNNPASGSFFTVGTHNITSTSQLGGGSCTFTVKVLDTPAPTISCPTTKFATAGQDDTATVLVGTPTFNASGGGTVSGVRSDSTPAVLDDDGNVITPAVEKALTDPYPVGITGITWTVTDADGRTASCRQRIVVRANTCGEDNEAPVITSRPPDITVGTGPGNTSPTIALDDELGQLEATDNCSVTIGITGLPPGSAFPIGTTSVTHTATDGSGNSVSHVQQVTVIDNTPPFIAAPPDASYVCPSQVPAAHPSQATRGDVFDEDGNLLPPGPPFDNSGSVNVTVTETSSGAGSAASPLVITRVFKATDPSNNSTSVTQTITVIDSTPPTLNVPADITAFLPLNSTAVSTPVTFAATASDNCSGAVSISYSPQPGSNFPVGTTTVTVTATDAAGNQTTGQFDVTVLYNFTGFFNPVGNLPVLNTVNAGRAIPVKFTLSGNKGLNIFATGSPASGQVTCGANAAEAEVTETVTAGGSSLSYDPSGDQYNYVWKTEGSWAGTCRQLVVTLNDGSVHRANFKFR